MKKKYELGGGPGMPPAISKNYSNGVKVGNFIFTKIGNIWGSVTRTPASLEHIPISSFS